MIKKLKAFYRSVRERLTRAQDLEALRTTLQSAEKDNLLDSKSLAMMEGVLQVSVLQVRDVLIPRPQVVFLSMDMPLSEMIARISRSAHSRFPVLGDGKDAVVGILHAKSLLAALSEAENVDGNSRETIDLLDVLRPAVFVPESKHLNTLLQEFRHNRNHMAVVVDEYGNVAGIVTIEDVIEQIVGEIEDEFDIDEDDHIKERKPGEYIVKGITPIEEFNAYFESHLDDRQFDTIAGFVANAFGHLPHRDEIISIDRFECKIIHADSRRIRLIRVMPKDLG